MAVEPLFGTRAQKAFIITKAVVVVTMVALTFGMVSLWTTFTDIWYKTLPCYLALFILAEIFELIMAFDALRLRNIIQLMGIVLFHGALIVFSALQFHETHVAIFNCQSQSDCVTDPNHLWNKVQPFLIVAPCIVAASWFFLMFWIKQLYAEFGWVIFHVVGANPKFKSMYQFYEIFICLLKFDFFCFVGVTMQLLIVVLSRDSAEFGVTIAAIPVVLLLLAGCARAVKHEVKWLMVISLALMLPAMSYLYKLDRFYARSSESQYISTRATLTVFTVVAFLLLLASLAIGIKCFCDFDKGLHESKAQGQSYTPVMMQVVDAFRMRGMSERQSPYSPGGIPLQPQISIE
ncbi:uncharacterized protein BJ212DRAFT_1256717 [Suillus subaureus]|uniref:Uncharacterized protein n=1 Tax=Suillus subaureus TaxID=48587 RepID=A0A9P7ENZ3_9AGAM|nr:uncharacterized protein BJ212DRAFT_1256717 [Suillus subaureus]KAG1827316.1 hypothetical protein BJ212DRAFT_1256717 [Suillus subaureus]